MKTLRVRNVRVGDQARIKIPLVEQRLFGGTREVTIEILVSLERGAAGGIDLLVVGPSEGDFPREGRSV